MLLVGLSLLLLREVISCPCSYSSELREVTCEANTQDLLPFYLPDCLGKFVDSDQVERLVLHDQSFPQIVSNAFADFPNIKHLDLSYCQINDMDQHALEENKNLNHLILTGNKLSDLPSLFTSSDNSFRSLTARHNHLQSINCNFLGKMLFIDLNDNLLTTNEITKCLSFFNNILEAVLESNLIDSIDRSTFANLRKLKMVSLWNNKISYIEPGSFDHLVNLHYLDITKNPVTEFTTESWHLCYGLEKKTLQVKGQVIQDLKVDAYTDEFCEAAQTCKSNCIEDFCTNDNGHLTCTGSIEDLVCELKKIAFKSIIFQFPKDINRVEVDNFFEAETNIFFREINQINGKSNLTKYLKDLKLYGTKFDLSTLDSYVGLRTETVTVFADTVYMRKAIENPITFKLNIRARVVSISENISMKMTREQFFQNLNSDQPVDNWAMVHEIISGVGDSSFSVRKLGYVEVQKATELSLIDPNQDICAPRTFTVQEYETEHKTAPDIFYNRVQINLIRMAVRTLASTRTNDELAMTMANHILKKTTNPSIVTDKKAYIVAQKLIRDKEILNSHTKNVPFYSTKVIKNLAEVMYDRMSDYDTTERALMLNLNSALGRMGNMNQNFEDARRMRELYFERELKTLEEIWNSTDSAWHFNFNASRNMENSIQDSIQKNGKEMFQLEKNELKEMLARAKETVISSQAVVDKFKEEIDRYSDEVTLSYKSQRNLLAETNKMGDKVKKEKDNFDTAIEKWKEEQILKAVFGFLTALVSVAVGVATMNPGVAAAGVAKGVAEAAESEEIADVMEAIVDLIKALQEMGEMLDTISEIEISGDIALEAALDWRGALENAYEMKNSTSKFQDMDTLGKTKIESVGKATDNGVDPADLQQAMSMYASRGGQLIQETVNFAKLMMHLADLTGELKAAETDLEISIDQVNRAIAMQVTLAKQHEDYEEWMNQHRDDYNNKCQEFAKEYDTASAERKEEFKKEITALFEKFKKAFEESNDIYVEKMNDLTAALYSKIAGVKLHSMSQRSIMMNLYQDFCDGLFYFSFTNCDSDNDVPTMSDSFSELLQKLNQLKWDLITSLENVPGSPQKIQEVVIHLNDSTMTGFKNGRMFGPVTALKEEQQMRIHLFNRNDELISSPGASADGAITFNVFFPLEFKDTDVNNDVFSFRAVKKTCTADYFTSEGSVHQMSECSTSKEFEGVNFKPSHDGYYKIVARNIHQEILDQVATIKVTVGGSYVLRAKK